MANDSILDVTKILDSYVKEIARDVTTDAEKVAQKGVDELRNVSPKRTGKYRKGWRVKTEKGNGYESVVIHNATAYQLTHLLEKPHLDRTGTRTITPKSVGHISRVEQNLIKEFENDVINIIERGV